VVIYANGKYYTTPYHFEERFMVRGISLQTIVAALENAEPIPSETNPDNDVYKYGGIAVVVNEEQEKIITVFKVAK
jgi:hypothetical protein